jgi:predicted DNA-binding transcriptional regulator YafY
MDQPKIERMLRLMKLLTANTSYTIDDIAQRLSMSRRTIYRYIDSFREAGFVIKKSGQHIRLDKESPHFKDISQRVHFTKEEAVILKRAIESIDDTNLLKQNLKRKLYSVYDNKILADTIVRGSNSATVHTLIEAIEEHRQVILKDYSSSHGSVVRDRTVEPFAFTTNYVQVWCYDTESHSCKLFKLSRIGSAELSEHEWQWENSHKQGFIDVFRMNGESQHHIQLKLGILAHNLLIEEYPLAEQYITPLSDGVWLFETDVANYVGVARFVVGLLDDIEIIDTPELERYLSNYVAKHWPTDKL